MGTTGLAWFVIQGYQGQCLPCARTSIPNFNPATALPGPSQVLQTPSPAPAHPRAQHHCPISHPLSPSRPTLRPCCGWHPRGRTPTHHAAPAAPAPAAAPQAVPHPVASGRGRGAAVGSRCATPPRAPPAPPPTTSPGTTRRRCRSCAHSRPAGKHSGEGVGGGGVMAGGGQAQGVLTLAARQQRPRVRHPSQRGAPSPSLCHAAPSWAPRLLRGHSPGQPPGPTAPALSPLSL